MAYCRVGEHDSELYLWFNGGEWYFDVPSRDQKFYVDNIADAVLALVMLRGEGVAIPLYALNRLLREQAGLPCDHLCTSPVLGMSVRVCHECKAVVS